MKNYRDLLEDILENGENVSDRTGIGTRRVFGRTLRFDLSQGFPMVTLREINFKGVIGELLWMLSGSTSVTELNERYGVNFWDPWKNPEGSIGPMYGRQLRNFNGDGHDQFKKIIEKIKAKPTDRRLAMTTFNPLEADEGVLWPCHGLVIQFNVSGNGLRARCQDIDKHGLRACCQDIDKGSCNGVGKGSEKSRLNLCVYQRSADVPIGLPYNISFYAALIHVVAVLTRLQVGELVLMMGDSHIYNNQLEDVKKMLQRHHKMIPSLTVDDFENLEDLKQDHFHLKNYFPHSKINFKVSV